MEDRPFAGEPTDSREAIMHATFVALQEHGYAGLSIQRIADQAELSKSTFYHHFDDKEDLLLSFAQFMLEQFIAILALETDDDPRETLETTIDLLLAEDFSAVDAETPTGADLWDVLGAYVEVRSQAVRNDEFRAAFTAMDTVLLDRFTDVVRRGIERGQFRDVDPRGVTAMIFTLLGGHLFGAATSDDTDVAAVRAELDHYLQTRVYASEGAR